MVIYEITAVVSEELTDRYEEYMLRQHIPAVLATGFFLGSSISRNGDRYRIRYKAKHQSKVDQYIEERAAFLRADFQKHFPTGVVLSRETWSVLASLEAPPR
ncbi:MAG: DUF4286 family protein [Pyrinomonadaceae bacterium]